MLKFPTAYLPLHGVGGVDNLFLCDCSAYKVCELSTLVVDRLLCKVGAYGVWILNDH